jgi:AmiR/NasT family two-component response regulator
MCGALVTCPGPRYRAQPCDLRELRGFLLSSEVHNIVELLGPREVIGQAIAWLMATNDMSRDAAFATLVRESSLSRRTVREVAAAIVAHRVE